MEKKHNEIECKPIDIHIIILKSILLISLSFMLLFIFAKYSSHLDVEQEDYRRENIKIVAIDLHYDPAIGQVLLIMVNISKVEVQKVELLVKDPTLIKEDLARC